MFGRPRWRLPGLTGSPADVTITRMRRALLLLALAGCASPAVVAPPDRVEEPEEVASGDPADSYLTDAQPRGVAGGKTAEQVAAKVARALRERGAEAEADGALGELAAWYLREWEAKRTLESVHSERVAQHHGFAGNLLGAVAASATGADADAWRESLAAVPVNLPVNRYGVRASPAGVAVAFGVVEADLRPFPRRVRPGRAVRLRGRIARRFAHGAIYLTGTDGKVGEIRLPAREVDARLRFPVPGVYQAELMGDGASGPVVLVNVPIYVGVAEPPLGSARGPAARPAPAVADGEARMLALLNGVRRRAGVPPLVADAELRAIALGHSQDMARGHFVGHVSPTTGTPEDRIKRAGVWLVDGGENVAQASSADGAHADLMNSPGHRANMLNRRFTHVGIALVPEGEQFVVTLVFGRRRDPAAPWTRREALAEIARVRSAHGLPPAQEDPMLAEAAGAGIAAFAQGGSAAAYSQTSATLNAELARRHVNQLSGCVRIYEIPDVDQLDELPVLRDARLHRIGVGTALHTEGKATMLVLLLVSEGARCD
jgi:uncharacterized protein YkwD